MSDQPVEATPTAPAPVKKKRRIFLWFFLAVQAIFIIWLIAGLSDSTTSCAAGDSTCQSAEQVGTSIGVFLIVIFWAIVDFILAVVYGIYRLARRP